MTGDPLREISETLLQENGGSFGFVCIWRKGDSGETARRMTVGEFLADPQNQSGDWYIDGGWGGPPGPIVVRWNGSHWINGGYCGHRFG